MATTDEVTIETEIEPTTTNNNVTTEQPTAGGLNVQQDSSAEAHAERLQKEQDLRKLDDEIRMLRQVLQKIFNKRPTFSCLCAIKAS